MVYRDALTNIAAHDFVKPATSQIGAAGIFRSFSYE